MDDKLNRTLQQWSDRHQPEDDRLQVMSRRIVTAAADTPFFPENLLIALQMAREAEDSPLAMAMTPDPVRKFARQPTFGLWSVALREDLRQALDGGLRKVIQWTEPHGCAKMVFNFEGGDPFFNVNTPEDMAIAKTMLKEFDA